MAPIQSNMRNGRLSANRKIFAATHACRRRRWRCCREDSENLRQVDGAAVQPPAPMIDWKRVRSIAISMNRGLALTATERTRATDGYRQLVEQCLPIVTEYTGIELPDAPERTFAVDRVDWIEANIDGFKRMFEPFEGLNPASDRCAFRRRGYAFNREPCGAQHGSRRFARIYGAKGARSV